MSCVQCFPRHGRCAGDFKVFANDTGLKYRCSFGFIINAKNLQKVQCLQSQKSKRTVEGLVNIGRKDSSAMVMSKDVLLLVLGFFATDCTSAPGCKMKILCYKFGNFRSFHLENSRFFSRKSNKKNYVQKYRLKLKSKKGVSI